MPTEQILATPVYDELAAVYDARYDRPECHAENTAVARHITALRPQPGRVLDVGAGTGLTLDLGLAHPDRYTAVDPSPAMLDELLRKHPTVRDVHREPFTAGSPFTGYDLIVALFGAASYLDPAALQSIPGRLNPGGRAVLMLYAPGYWPDYYTHAPATATPARDTALALPGAAVIPLTNYTVVTL